MAAVASGPAAAAATLLLHHPRARRAVPPRLLTALVRGAMVPYSCGAVSRLGLGSGQWALPATLPRQRFPPVATGVPCSDAASYRRSAAATVLHETLALPPPSANSTNGTDPWSPVAYYDASCS